MPQEYVEDQLLILNALRCNEGIPYLELRRSVPVWPDSTYREMVRNRLLREAVKRPENIIVVFSTSKGLALS